MAAVQFFVRGAVVSLTVLGYSLVWLIGWVCLLLSLRARSRRQAWFANRLRALMTSLGATYVKVGQIMSTRPDLFPPHIITALERLQDDVGGFSYRHVERTLSGDFGASPEELFSEFSEQPIASASVAQVHRARLKDGRVVAVKVRRPRIERIVKFDLRIMRLVARIISVVPAIRLLAPVDSVNEFGRAINMQVDLTIEASNNGRFRANFADSADIEFPELIPELCSERVLTMTFVEGVKILQFRSTRADPTRLARVGFHTLLKMVFEDGFVHADLHPGNILITPAEKVAILDLGLTAELDETHRRAFAQFFAAWAQGDGKIMAGVMAEFSPTEKIGDYKRYEADICEFVARYYGKALGEVLVSTVAFDLMGIMRRHRVRVNATFTMVNIAIAVTEGIGRQLDPKLDLMQETIPFFMRLQSQAKF